MRFLPLLSSRQSPIPWISFGDVELAWEEGLHEGWTQAVRNGLSVHALHLPQRAWGEELLGEALEALREQITAPKRVVRDADGKVVGVETVPPKTAATAQ